MNEMAIFFFARVEFFLSDPRETIFLMLVDISDYVLVYRLIAQPGAALGRMPLEVGTSAHHH